MDTHVERFVILGSSGWIGQALQAWIAERVGPNWRAHVRCFGSKARRDRAPDQGEIEVACLADLKGEDVAGALVFHLAYLTKDKVDGMSDADFFARNLEIDSCVMAALRTGAARGLFVASSGAARDVETGASKNLYGITKLLQEDRFQTFAKQSHTPTFIGRIFNIAGGHINKFELYALSSFVRQALQHQAIRIEAAIPVYRSFLHVEDLIALVVATLSREGLSSAPIDLCGAEVLEMGAIAQEVARQMGMNAGQIHRPDISFERTSSYLGDPRATLGLALRHTVNLRGFAQQVSDTIAYMTPLVKPD
jgi:nucleoside-diphosphate-sugar epimerase